MSASVTGRRKARRLRVDRIVRAQGSSSLAVAGRQTKIRERLGVSPGPVTLYGPPTTALLTCGGAPFWGTWKRWTFWPSSRRANSAGSPGGGGAGGAAPRRTTGVSSSGFVDSLRKAAPTVRKPALTGRRISKGG